MPIRFRCAYCNQLMGISQRKIGTIVRCPKCSGQVVVPHGEETPETDRLAPEHDNVVKSLEDPELEMLLAGAAKEAAGLPKSKRKAAHRPVIEIDVEPIEIPLPRPQPPGAATPGLPAANRPTLGLPASESPSAAMIVLPRSRAIAIGVAVIVLISLAFAAGFFLGKMSFTDG